MKKIYLTIAILICLAGQTMMAQPTIQWQKSMGGTNNDVASCIIQTNDGGFITAGYTNSNNGDVSGNHDTTGNTADYWIVKMDATGAVQWQKCYGGSGDDKAYGIVQANDGGYTIVGQTNSTDGDVGPHAYGYIWIIKIDSIGTIQWQKCYGDSSSGDMPTAIIKTTDHGYAISSYTFGLGGDVTGNHGGSDYWVFKIDSIGNLQWEHSYGGSNEDLAYSLIQTSDGGYAIIGGTASNNGDVILSYGGVDVWLIKTDAGGTIQWSKTYGGDGESWGYSIAQMSDGGYVVAGYTDASNGQVTNQHGNGDCWAFRVDEFGNIIWELAYGGGYQEWFYSIIPTSDNGFVMGGYTQSNTGDVTGNHGMYDYWIVKRNAAGNIDWEKCYGSSMNELSNSMIATNDGGYAFAGYSYGNDGDVTGHHGTTTYSDSWIVKLVAPLVNCSASFYVYPDTTTPHHYFIMDNTAGNPPIQYYWSWGDGNHDTIPYPSHTYVSAGYYNVCLTLTDATLCTSSHCDSSYLARVENSMIYVDVYGHSQTGVNEINYQNSISIYPNPASTILNVHTNSQLSTLSRTCGTQLIITDLLGNEVYKEMLTGIDNTISISNFSNGLYFYEVRGINENLRGKFIVQK